VLHFRGRSTAPTTQGDGVGEELADLRRAFRGTAFSSQATVADLKQASIQIAGELASGYPDSPDCWNVQAQLQFHLGNTPEAVKLWERCLAANPRSADALYGLGYIAYLEGDNAKAVERFRAAMTASPQDGRIPILLAESLTRLGKPQEAEHLLLAYLNTAQGSVTALETLGQVYLDLRQFDKARIVFQKLADLDPHDRKALFGLATAWGRLGNAQESKRAMTAFQGLTADWRAASTARVIGFDDLAKGRSVAVLIHNETARAYFAHGNLEKAEAAWLMASALDPKNVQCRKELAGLYERSGRDRWALEACEELRDLEPGNADYWLNVGLLNGRLARYQAALAAVEQAIKLDPANARYRRAQELLRSAP
jgi:tetratricopeptide (TPR) repeat protein